MNEEQIIKEIVLEHLRETDIFLVEFEVKPGDLVEISIDGDHEIRIEDCVRLSKYLEGRIEKEMENSNYEIHVSSYGADQPLIFPRQINKAIGKMVQLKNAEGKKVKGTLTGFDGIQLTVEVVKTSAVKGVKDKMGETEVFILDDLKEIRRTIMFK